MSASPFPDLSVPVLETERLLLRAHRLSDFPHSASMWADPNVTRYIGGTPCSEEESWTRFLRYAGHWSLLGFGYWLAEQKATGEFIGEIGFSDYHRDITPPLPKAPEIGWVLASHAHGKGYATEAVRAVVAWGDRRFEHSRTLCLIHPDNAASIRVAAKCGYVESQRAVYKGHPTMIFVREPAVAASTRPHSHD